MALVLAGAVLIAINWGIYIWAVNNGQVVEAALGYFINPLVSVLFGVLIFARATADRAVGGGRAGRAARWRCWQSPAAACPGSR